VPAVPFNSADHPCSAWRRPRKLARDERLHFRLLHAGSDDWNRVCNHPARAFACSVADVVELRARGELRKRGQIMRCGTIRHFDFLLLNCVG
jgi:hypothetical protein